MRALPSHCLSGDPWHQRLKATAFVNLTTGKPYHSSTIQQDFLRPTGKQIDFKDELGWHTFRRSYRSMLDAAGAPIGVQQQLMRHGQMSTTMNTTKCLYGGEAGCQWEGSPNRICREKGSGYCASSGLVIQTRKERLMGLRGAGIL